MVSLARNSSLEGFVTSEQLEPMIQKLVSERDQLLAQYNATVGAIQFAVDLHTELISKEPPRPKAQPADKPGSGAEGT